MQASTRLRGLTLFLATQPASGNTGLDYQVLYYNDGDYNTAEGFRALFRNTSGTQNTATGAYALFSAPFTNETGPLWGEGACMGGGQRKRRLILAIQPRLNPTPYDISEQRRTQVKFSVMLFQSVMQLQIRVASTRDATLTGFEPVLPP